MLCLATLLACSKDGKDGINGKDGTDGKDGNNGRDGNAGVKMYVWGLKSTDNTIITYNIPELSLADARKSIIYAYYSPHMSPERWYAVPGIGWMVDVEVLVSGYFMDAAESGSGRTGLDYVTQTLNLDGTPYLDNDVFFGGFRIIVVPVPDENIKAKSTPPIDFGNYAEVAAYYGLKE
jgi:hypothetical protein